MSVLYNIVQFISTFIESFIIVEFMRCIFSKLTSKKYLKFNIFFSMTYMICIRMLHRYTDFSYLILLIATLLISGYIIFVYKNKAIVALSISSFYVLCLHVHSLVCLLFVSTIGNKGKLYETVLHMRGIETIWFVVLERITLILISFVIMYLLKKHKVRCELGYKSLVIIAMGTVGIVFLTNETLTSFDVQLTYAWLLVIAIIVLLTFYGYAKTVDRLNKTELQIKEMRYLLLEDKYQAIREIYMNNAKAYHDLNNHLNILYNLLEEENVEGAQKYIEMIGESIRKEYNETRID